MQDTLFFTNISSFPRGTLLALLRDAYGFDPYNEVRWGRDWEAFDTFFYDNPHIADSYGLMSTIQGLAIGFVSWDPRHRPAYVEIGHNCIATAFKGRGYGTAQMREALRRISDYGVEKVIVTTNRDFWPAHKMYERVGFQVVSAQGGATGVSSDLIPYTYSPREV